jgi:hypothetical protein
MIRKYLSGLVLAGALATIPLTQGDAQPLASTAATHPNIITVQGWPGSPGQERREYCWNLQNRARELRQQIYYAPPWDRDRMERHLWGVRERLRDQCWGGGR